MIEQNGGKQENHILHRFCRWYYLFDKFDNEVVLINISLLPPWFGDLHTYVTQQKNNNEKKVKMKQKRTTNKNTWANNYIVRRVSRIRIERKDEEIKDIFVHVTKWSIHEKSMTTRAYQGYGNCERKTKVNNNTHKWKED